MGEVKFSTIQLHPFILQENVVKYIILQRHHNSKYYPNMWQVVTGKINPNEKAYQAAVRELKEETGLEVDKLYHIPFIGSFYDWRNDNIEQIPCFAAEVSNTNIKLSHEHLDYRVLDYEELNSYLSLPSHLIAAEYLKKHIIDNPNSSNFLIHKK